MITLDKNKKYLLGCSYGPDSMALFYLLLKDGYNFDVAIVNYHLRPESDSEVEGLRKFCEKHNKKLNILDVVEVPNKNIEENCRNIRYEFFAQLIRENKYEGLLVAHHQDDLLETYLMQRQRQICPIYYGMKDKSHIFGIDVYRPLLHYTKKELQEICAKNNVPFMIDKSNNDIVFVRNKIRHNVVRKLNDEERKKLLDEIDEENKKLDVLLSSISLSKLKNKDYILSLDEKSVLYALNMLKNQAGNFPDLSKKQCMEIIKILKSEKPNVSCEISKSLIFYKEYDNIRFSEVDQTSSYAYVVTKPCKLDTPYFYLDFTKDTKDRNVRLEDYPLTIRNIKLDDRYKIRDYLTTGRRLLIDWKVPSTLRKVWPVIISCTGQIIYIPRYKKDFVPNSDTNFFVKIK